MNRLVEQTVAGLPANSETEQGANLVPPSPFALA